MIKDDEEGKVSYTNKELSELIQMSPSTISRVNHSLQDKGYLNGASEITKKFQLRKLDQLFIWKFKQQDEKFAKIENALYEIVEQNKQLKKKIELLEKKNNIKDDSYIIKL